MLNFLGYVTPEARAMYAPSQEMLKQPLPTVFTQYFLINYNKDVLPRRTRSSGKLRLPSFKLECTKKILFFLSWLCNF